MICALVRPREPGDPRGSCPGASLRFATSPSRVSDRMAVHGFWCIDTGASCNHCYILPASRNAGRAPVLPS